MIVVLDANVWLSGFLGLEGARSVPAEVILRWRNGDFKVATSHPILREVERAFRSPYFQERISLEARLDLFDEVRANASIPILLEEIRGIATHKEDDLVLATAIAAGAGLIVTRDIQLLKLGRFRDVSIVSPLTFLEILDSTVDDAEIPNP